MPAGFCRNLRESKIQEGDLVFRIVNPNSDGPGHSTLTVFKEFRTEDWLFKPGSEVLIFSLIKKSKEMGGIHTPKISVNKGSVLNCKASRIYYGSKEEVLEVMKKTKYAPYALLLDPESFFYSNTQ